LHLFQIDAQKYVFFQIQKTIKLGKGYFLQLANLHGRISHIERFFEKLPDDATIIERAA